jgi:uncharacterized membrane-anchored protein YjiN (DUF445 family)
MKLKKKVKSNKTMKKTIVPKSTSKVQSEVKRILTSNMTRMELDESHMPFASRFLTSLLKEQDEQEAPVADSSENQLKTPEDFTPEGDKQAFDQSLEPTTDPNEFETQGISPDITSDTINSIKEWSDKLGDFANFLNDPSTESLHKILADGDRAGSLLRGVTRKASDSITRIAGEVEKLKEILNTYIITAPKKLRDTEQLKAGS